MSDSRQPTPQTKYKNMGLVVIIFSLFFLPLLAAYWAANQGNGYFHQTKNKGRLVQPLVPIEKITLQNESGEIYAAKNLKGHWSLLYVQPKACDENCQRTLYNLRQLHVALGKDMPRVKRYIATFEKDGELDSFLQKYSVQMQHLLMGKDQFAERTSHMHPKAGVFEQGEIVIVDPEGYMTLSYTADVQPDDIYDDLTHLLKVSQIG